MEVYFFCSFLLGMLIENHRFIRHTHTHTQYHFLYFHPSAHEDKWSQVEVTDAEKWGPFPAPFALLSLGGKCVYVTCFFMPVDIMTQMRDTDTHTHTHNDIYTDTHHKCWHAVSPSFSEVMNADEVVKGITGVRHKGVGFNNDVQWGGKCAACLFFLLLLNLLQR